MPKTVIPLTATKLANLKPRQKTYRVADGAGLYINVKPSGAKFWELRLSTLGKTLYKNNLSLKEARAWRAEMREKVAKNLNLEDDIEYSYSFKKLFYDWHELWSQSVTAPYARQVKYAVEKNIFPSLGNMRVANIKPLDIVKALKSMEARGVLEYLRRTKTGIKLALDYAVSLGIIDFNPAVTVASNVFKKHTSTHLLALAPRQLPDFIRTIEIAKIKDKITVQTYFLIYFQLITMTRPVEAASVKWRDIDKGLWTIKAENMKARREQVIPLTPMLESILDFLKQVNRGEYVFQGLHTHVSSETVRMAFKRLGIHSTAHGLRALARTYLAETGMFREEVLEACLAHSVGNKTEQAYNRAIYLEERRKVLTYWSSVIENERAKTKIF